MERMTQLCHMPFYWPQECICVHAEINVIHYYVNQDQRSCGSQVGNIVPNETFAFLYQAKKNGFNTKMSLLCQLHLHKMFSRTKVFDQAGIM